MPFNGRMRVREHTQLKRIRILVLMHSTEQPLDFRTEWKAVKKRKYVGAMFTSAMRSIIYALALIRFYSGRLLLLYPVRMARMVGARTRLISFSLVQWIDCSDWRQMCEILLLFVRMALHHFRLYWRWRHRCLNSNNKMGEKNVFAHRHNISASRDIRRISAFTIYAQWSTVETLPQIMQNEIQIQIIIYFVKLISFPQKQEKLIKWKQNL